MKKFDDIASAVVGIGIGVMAFGMGCFLIVIAYKLATGQVHFN